MTFLFLTPNFQTIRVNTPSPGDSYIHPIEGPCRRLTAQRLCLASERLGKESDALQGLLKAILDVSEKNEYDGRSVDAWFGLVGAEVPTPPPDDLVPVNCPRCGSRHYALMEKGEIWNGGVCSYCWLN